MIYCPPLAPSCPQGGPGHNVMPAADQKGRLCGGLNYHSLIPDPVICPAVPKEGL